MPDLYSTIRKPLNQQYGGATVTVTNAGTRTAVLPKGTTIPATAGINAVKVSTDEWDMVPPATRTALSLS